MKVKTDVKAGGAPFVGFERLIGYWESTDEGEDRRQGRPRAVR